MEIYGRCQALGLDALLNDPNEHPGVKFENADLTACHFGLW
jgi:hypothetical protein